MVHGRVVRPPRPGARLASLDPASVEALPGVLAVVREGSFVGVLADAEDQVEVAAAALARRAVWTGGTELPRRRTRLAAGAAGRDHGGRALRPATGRHHPARVVHPAPAGPRLDRARLRHRPVGRRRRAGVDAQPGGAPAAGRDRRGARPRPRAGTRPARRGRRLLRPQRRRRRRVRRGAAGPAVPGRPVRVQWSRADELGWSPFGSAMAVDLAATVEAATAG